MPRSSSPPSGDRPRPALRRIALLAIAVATSGWLLGTLLGSPAGHLSLGADPAGLLASHLSDAALRRALTWCCWGCWLVLATVAAPMWVASRRPSIATGVAPALAVPGPISNPYEVASAKAVDGCAPARGDDTMGDPLAWDERSTDPGRRTRRGSAEARMTMQSTDGGTVAEDDREERERPRAREATRPGPTPLPPPIATAPEAAPAPPRAECATSPRLAGIVRVPLPAGGDPSIALTSLGSLAVLGDPDDVADLLCSMVVDAAAGRVGTPADVVLVGFGEAMHGLDGIVVVPDERAAVRLTAPPGAPGHAARGATVVFVGARRDAAGLRELLATASPCPAGPAELEAGDAADEADAADQVTGGTAVVVAGDCAEARWRLDLRAGSLEEALVRQLGRTTPAASADPTERPEAPADTPVEVCVLGPVRVNGTEVPFERRPKLTELVVYLALHPDGASTDSWATALWPDRRMPMSTLSNRLSETRLSLGYAPDGFAHLRKRGGRYHLGPYVTTDWDRFQKLAAGDNPAGWRAALALVRGRPFEGLREAQWTLLEGVVPAIEAALVELACRLAEHLLAVRDPEGAEWAARRAMLACPWDERLYRLVMRAADAAGNRPGVEAALRQLACVLELGEEPLSAVHPETAALYRSLTSRRAVL